jgi:hypothetical protein
MIAKIYTEIPTNIITVFHAQKKRLEKVEKLLIKYLRSFQYSSFILRNDNCLRNFSIQWKREQFIYTLCKYKLQPIKIETFHTSLLLAGDVILNFNFKAQNN